MDVSNENGVASGTFWVPGLAESPGHPRSRASSSSPQRLDLRPDRIQGAKHGFSFCTGMEGMLEVPGPESLVNCPNHGNVSVTF